MTRFATLFTLARFLPEALLRRAIKIVRQAEDYSRREELLKLLHEYLVRRSTYPQSLQPDSRAARAKLKGPPTTLTLPQRLAALSPRERLAVLEESIARLEKQAAQERSAGRTKGAKGKRKKVGGEKGQWERARGGGAADARVAAIKGKHPTGRPRWVWGALKESGRTVFRGGPKLRGGGSRSTRVGVTAKEREAILWYARKVKSRRPRAEGAPARKRKPAKRVVSTGFALPAQAANPIKSNMPLKAGEKYYFWLEVGARVRGTIELRDEVLPTEKLPRGAMLDVVLFEVEDGLKLVPGEDIGKLKLESDGTVAVKSQPAKTPPPGFSSNSPLLGKRLFFPVIAPGVTGNFRLRCNIYYRRLLVQSRTVNARVMRRPQAKEKALQAKVDYTLSRTLSVDHVGSIRPHLLSIMLNSNGNGTHDFFFFGDQEFKKDNISFNGQELQGLIAQARNAYALAAWGSNNPWQNQIYRYDKTRAQNLQQLKGDLTRFAIRGYNIYDKIVNRLAGGAKNAAALAALMKRPGMVQIALKESPSFILPAAIIYDYSIDVDAASSKFTLCPSFLEALEGNPPLEDSDCFKGNCPTRDDDTVVCPSGFWGYRHQLGLPLSVADAPDAPTDIGWRHKPIITVGVSTDPLFILREKHLQTLRAIRSAGLEWNYGETRDEVIKKLKETKPQLVYFYCHGGVTETRPYIQVGAPDPSGNLSPSFLREKKIHWDVPRPLVFINGCHTTALEPEQAIEFITPFIENANAAGVIGTEITIFEPLASVFGEECLRRFLGNSTIGDAVRCTRLKLLKDANPLGLVYIPYVMANLRLVELKNNT